LLADLKKAHATLQHEGKALTFRSYRRVGAFSASTINTRFGSWNVALEKAGLTLAEEKNVPADLLFDNLRTVWIAGGRQPSFREMSAHPSRYTASTYAARFGGWRKALETFSSANSTAAADVFGKPIAAKSPASRTSRSPSLALKFQVLKRDRFRCLACGRSPAGVPGVVLEVDHVVAWSKGGETTFGNLQTLCFDRNRGKQALCAA
jgi:hypothetical protein